MTNYRTALELLGDERIIQDAEEIETTLIHPEHVASYVMCVYGPDGDQPGDCYTAVARDADGWYVTDGDDTHREEHPERYRSRAAAVAAAEEIAAAAHEGQPGEDAEDMTVRLLRERAGTPDPDGEWCVYWETVGDDAHVVERYSSEDAATAAATLAQDELRLYHPGGNLLCGYSVRVLVGDEWSEVES